MPEWNQYMTLCYSDCAVSIHRTWGHRDWTNTQQTQPKLPHITTELQMHIQKKNKQQQPCSVHRVSSAETAIAAITLANLQSLTVTNQRETPSHLFSCWLRTRAEEVPSRTSGVGEHLAQAYIQNDTLGNSISEEHLKKRRLHGFIIHVVPKAQNTTSRTCTNFAF